MTWSCKMYIDRIMSGLWRVHTSSLHWWTKNTTWSKISHQHWLHLLLTNCIGKLQNYVYVIISMVRGWGSPGGRSIGCMETRCKRKHRCLNWIPRNIYKHRNIYKLFSAAHARVVPQTVCCWGCWSLWLLPGFLSPPMTADPLYGISGRKEEGEL